jgi:hypothetical protein
MLRNVAHGDMHYSCLMFVCPGCAEDDGNTGMHMLPVNTTEHSPSWAFDGNLEAPTISPSILTRSGPGGVRVCHSFLRGGVFEFLGDCTHSMANQHIPMPDLPEWVLDS